MPGYVSGGLIAAVPVSRAVARVDQVSGVERKSNPRTDGVTGAICAAG